MIEKKVLLIDMDGVLVDFQSEVDDWLSIANDIPYSDDYYGDPDNVPGIFRNPRPIPGALNAVDELLLCGKYELFVATTAPWGNPQAAADKRYWIERWFGKIFHKKMFITHRKDMLNGDILIDDRIKNGAGNFKGELIHFGKNHETQEWNEYPDWDSVLKKLL